MEDITHIKTLPQEGNINSEASDISTQSLIEGKASCKVKKSLVEEDLRIRRRGPNKSKLKADKIIIKKTRQVRSNSKRLLILTAYDKEVGDDGTVEERDDFCKRYQCPWETLKV